MSSPFPVICPVIHVHILRNLAEMMVHPHSL